MLHLRGLQKHPNDGHLYILLGKFLNYQEFEGIKFEGTVFPHSASSRGEERNSTKRFRPQIHKGQ